jgi:threonine synthase
MDVGNPSNFARILWLYRNEPEKLRADVIGSAHDDEETLRTIGEVHRRTSYLLDPHSAVGYLGALDGLRESGANATAVVLATAHPAKFRETVEEAIGGRIELPSELAAVAEAEETIISIESDYSKLREYLTA